MARWSPGSLSSRLTELNPTSPGRRILPFTCGDSCGQRRACHSAALYLRARRAHRLADTPTLWLGDGGRGFSYAGLHKALVGRAELAGIKGFHPHVLRHTAASRWLAAGGSEGGLMAVAGWARREMMDRYVQATRAERAADEARRLGLGDL
jgi:integrase